MTEPLAQTALEDDMRRVMQRLEQVTQSTARRARDAAEAEHAYKVAKAKAFLTARADGEPAAACDAYATVASETEYLTHLGAEAALKAAQEAGRNARAEADMLRSLNSNHRALVVGE